MSSRGFRNIQLARRQEKRLRQRRAKNQAKSLLNSCRKQIKGISDPIIQQILADKLAGIQGNIEQAGKNLSSNPESALDNARSIQSRLQQLLSDARLQAEKMRFEKVKQQAGDLVNSSRDMIRSISDPAVQQIIGPEVKQIRDKLETASELIETSPDTASKRLNKIQKQLQKILSKAQKTAQENARQQAAAQSALELAKQNIESQRENSNKATEDLLHKGLQKTDQAARLYKQGEYQQVTALCDDVQGICKQIEEKSFDETVRKQVVGRLLKTLEGMGFVMDGPVIEGKDSKESVVKLSGKLPSGKKASFTVNLDGRMEFDFDGYQGRGCAKEMDNIEEKLKNEFEIELGPAQVTWKNPDRLSKGAMDLPGSNSINQK